MTIKKSIFVFFICSLFLTSCFEVAKEIKDWTQIDDINNIDEKMHYLSDDGIKLFLPKSFKKYSSVEYLNLIDSLIVNHKDLEIEHTRFKYIREMEGNHYTFFDNTINATYTLNTLPYIPIYRQDAKYILGVVRQKQEMISSQSNLKYSKVTAKHNDNGKTQIFKAIFKIENQKLQQQVFQHAYYISSNQKTVLIHLMAPFQINFDPFLEKMIL